MSGAAQPDSAAGSTGQPAADPTVPSSATAEMAEKLPVSHGLLAWREAEPSTTLTRDPGRDSGPGLL